MAKKETKVPYKDPSIVAVDNGGNGTAGSGVNPDYVNPLRTVSRPTFHGAQDETTFGSRQKQLDDFIKNQQQFKQDYPQLDEFGNPVQTQVIAPTVQQPLQNFQQPTALNLPGTDVSGTTAGDLLRGVTRTPDVLSGITVNDYAPSAPVGGATGDLGAATYFPGAQVQPLQYHGMAGGYFRELPLFMGGKTIYPFGVADARKKALEDAALKAQLEGQKSNDALWDKYKIPKGKPVYQPAINKYYTDQIYSPMKKIFDDYGYRKAVSILNDPNQPETQQIMQNYVNLEQLAKAQTDLDGTIAKLTDDIKAGRVLAQNISPGTQGLLNKYSQTDMISAFNNGDIKLEDIAKLPQLINTYVTLDTKTTDLKGFIGEDINSWYEDGIYDEKTKQMIHYGDAKFISEVKKKMLDPTKMDEWVQLYMNDPTLTPDVKDPAMIRKYLETAIPTQLEQQLKSLQKPSGNTFNFGDKNAKTYTLNEKGEISQDVAISQPGGGTKRDIVKIPYMNGVTFASNDIQVLAPIPSNYITDYNIVTPGQEGTYKKDFVNGDIVGLYKFAKNKDGVMVTPGSPSADGTDWFAGVQVQETRPASGFGALAGKTENYYKTYFIPADKVNNQVGFVIKDNEVTINPNVVNKKSTQSSEKNYTVPGTTVPNAVSLQPK